MIKGFTAGNIGKIEKLRRRTTIGKHAGTAASPADATGMMDTAVNTTANAGAVVLKMIRHIDTENIMFAVVAFLIGRAGFPGGFLPFSLPFFTAVPTGFTRKAVVFVSLLIGTLTAGNHANALITSGSILLYCIMNHLSTDRDKSHKHVKNLQVTAITAFASSVAIGALPVFAGGFLLYDFLKVILQGVMVIILVPVMRNVFLFYNDCILQGPAAFRNSERLVSAVIVIVTCLSFFSGIIVFDIRLINAAYVIVILIVGYISGPGPGAAAGLIAGLMAGMAPSMPISYITGTYAFCGLLSGFMRRFGKGGSGLGFILGNTLMAIMITTTFNSMACLAEIMIGITVFLFIPLNSLREQSFPMTEEPYSGTERDKPGKRGHVDNGLGYGETGTGFLKDDAIDKLHNYSVAFSKLSRMFGNLSKTGKSARKTELCALFERINETACADCGLSRHCWDINLSLTYNAVIVLIKKMDKNGRIERADIPPYFAQRCERIKDFIMAVNSSYELYKAGMIWKDKESDNWMMISRQFAGFANIAENMQNEIHMGRARCLNIEAKIRSVIPQFGIRHESVYVWRCASGKYRVVIRHAGCKGKLRICDRLGGSISAAVGRKMKRTDEGCSAYSRSVYARSVASADRTPQQCILEYEEDEPLRVITGVCGMAKASSDEGIFVHADVVTNRMEEVYAFDESDTQAARDIQNTSTIAGRIGMQADAKAETGLKSVLSGDTCVYFKTGDGKFVMALSDGMGTGKSAAIQSSSAIYMLQELIDMGFDLDASVEMINTMVLCKTGNESYTTLDISCIDLFNGDVRFMKMGAAPAYIKNGCGGVDIVKAVSLPAGVMPCIDTELVHKAVSGGDIIVMVSDGIIEALGDAENDGCIGLKRILEHDVPVDPQELADFITKTAFESCSAKYGRLAVYDDMTVMAARILERSDVAKNEKN